MPHRSTPNKSFCNLRHRDRRLHARLDAEFFHRVLQRERVDNSREHAHVIAGGAFDTLFTAGNAAENIAASDDDYDLHPELADFSDLPRRLLDSIGSNTGAALSSKGFAAEFEQDSAVFG